MTSESKKEFKPASGVFLTIYMMVALVTTWGMFLRSPIHGFTALWFWIVGIMILGFVDGYYILQKKENEENENDTDRGENTRGTG